MFWQTAKFVPKTIQHRKQIPKKIPVMANCISILYILFLKLNGFIWCMMVILQDSLTLHVSLVLEEPNRDLDKTARSPAKG